MIYIVDVANETKALQEKKQSGVLSEFDQHMEDEMQHQILVWKKFEKYQYFS